MGPTKSTIWLPLAREQRFRPRGQTGPEAPSNTDFAVGGPSGAVGRAYEGFLRLPVAMVLIALWLCGFALVRGCGVSLYLIGATLLWALG
jgi:hypothetical protein